MDGFADVLEICRGTPNTIFINNGKGALKDSTLDVAVADINGDNKLDLVLANRDDQLNTILLGSGNGTFEKPTQFGADAKDTRAVSVEDMNGDGKGVLSLNARFGDNEAKTYGLAFGDVNGDGKIDIVTAESRAVNRIFYQ